MKTDDCTPMLSKTGAVIRRGCTVCMARPRDGTKGFRFFLKGGQHVCDTHGLEHYKASLVPQATTGIVISVTA